MQKLTIIPNGNRLQLSVSSHTSQEGILEYHCQYRSDPGHAGALDAIPQIPLSDHPFLHLFTRIDGAGVAGQWRPDSGAGKHLGTDWDLPSETNLSHSAPVICLFDGSDRNVCTISASEVSRNLQLLAGIHEENGQITLHLILHLTQPVQEGTLQVRFDFRSLPFYEVLQDTAGWWDAQLPDPPMDVPDSARLPMYSTWYSYHQELRQEELYQEYEEAARLGMGAAILDDGWQTSDNNRGYGFCGDWNPEPGKFPDFAAHTEKLHQLGMKVLVWYSVPFVGEFSQKWDAFRSMLLHYDPVTHAGILDPRYPQVRDYLLDTYRQAAARWNLDGFKLDFIDSFRAYPDTPDWNPSMDFQEIQEAVYHLMLTVSQTLTKHNPQLLIEFRQNYTGPQMRRFGNIFRVSDCPMAGVTNRTGIADLRLLSRSSAVHSDMLMWPPEETPENIAVQLISCIFATLQISVRLPQLTADQKSVLKHYLQFSLRYRDVLQKGTFTAHNPLARYPFLSSSLGPVWIGAVYDSRQVAVLPGSPEITEYWILNGTTDASLYLSLPGSSRGTWTVFDCRGRETEVREATPGSLENMHVPSGGSLRLLV